MNTQKFNQVVSEAKTKAAGHPEWLRAIEKAAAAILDGSLVVTLFADDTALVTSPNGSYRVNGACPCAARTAHCYHRAAKRLTEMMETAPVEKNLPIGKEISTARAQVINDIKNIWPRVEPTVHLADALMARFGKNKLEFLDDDMLRRVRLAIAA